MSECPCGSGPNYEACCEPLIKGRAHAESAESLMRARYTAYVKHEVNFLKESLFPSERGEFDAAAVRKWSNEAEWMGLKIHKTEKGLAEDKVGTVIFTAHYATDGEEHEHEEVAEFKRGSDGHWYFVDGKVVGEVETLERAGPKVGRNDPCTCGSGKKFKKCCG